MQLPLGLANKAFFALDRAEDIGPDVQVVGNPHRTETGSYYLRPFGRPVVEAFYGGMGARALEGEAATIDFAMEELSGLFGNDFRRRLRPLILSAWNHAAYIGGSYSHALPDHAAARGLLAQPVEERIFFAGEACSAADFSTAHGASETGVTAAEAALAALRRDQSSRSPSAIRTSAPK